MQKTSQNYCCFYIVRHAESEGNIRGVIAGHLDSNLTQKGEQQAQQTAKDLQSIPFAAVFSSDLIRAKRTAEIIAHEHKLLVKPTQALRERNYGNLQGEEEEEVRDLFNQYNRMSYKKRLKVKLVSEMESDEEIISRFVAFLRQTASAYAGKTILIVSHGALMKVLLVYLGYGTHQELQGSIENTGYFKLLTDNTNFFVKEAKGITKQSQ